VKKNIHWARHTLVLETLLPKGGEAEHTVCVAIQDIQEGLRLSRIYLVTVNPDLEITGNTRLANGLHELRNHGHVIINHHDMRLLLANGLR
jgi:hypothetical protein